MKILTKGEYYGEKRLELDNKGIVLSEYDYQLPKTDWHYHENPYFMYIIEGNVYDVNKKRTTNCTPGSLLLHNWDETHYNSKASSTARGFHIEFEREWFDQKKLDVDLWEGSHLIHNPKMHHLLGRLYFEFKCQDEYSELSIDLLLLELCETSQADKKLAFLDTPVWVETLRELLHEHDLHNYSLAELSSILGVHPVHISRAVPKYFSVTLGNYIRQQKTKKAMGYLYDPNYSLTEIAYLCGFADQSHFTRTFRSFFEMTPKEFRVRL
ncbi:AraC family transcriptional regulator [Maribacter halichondriae]|uniref:AraC family transcriptional regulator n=1 Tax=Maribacter halichondriae TaxID=2980554 RepID=UPI002359AE01|nr:AraC family transcriptional regulator [Maribacter sp. Hal144]